MFYKKTLTYDLSIHPKSLDTKIADTVKARLIEAVEGKCHGKHGYVVVVVKLPDTLSMGRISPDTGAVHYRIKYDAILLLPFKDEIMDAEVHATTTLGFFCKVGPLQIFVTRHAMPQELAGGYDAETGRWISDDEQVQIYKGCGVRLKIMGIEIKTNKIDAIGTIKEDYLGLIARPLNE